MRKVASHTERSEPAANGLATVVEYQTVGSTKYFDAAGFPGRTLGLKAQPASTPSAQQAAR